MLAAHFCQTDYTVIRFLGVSAKFGPCTVVSVNGILVEAKMCTFTLESTHFIFNKCPIYTHDGASAKYSTNSLETDYSVPVPFCSSNLSDFSKAELRFAIPCEVLPVLLKYLGSLLVDCRLGLA
jgi:hypothetical protein